MLFDVIMLIKGLYIYIYVETIASMARDDDRAILIERL